MTKQKQELIKGLEKQSHQLVNRTIILGSIIAILIAITPYFFYLYENVSQNSKVWETFLFSYEVEHYDDANWFAWILMQKLIPLLLLFIWFFTCRHWWHHALLIPISMYAYQIIVIFNDDNKYVDEFQLMHLVPLMALIIPSIYLVRARLFNRLNTVDKSTQELEDELTFKPKTVWGKIRQFF